MGYLDCVPFEGILVKCDTQLSCKAGHLKWILSHYKIINSKTKLDTIKIIGLRAGLVRSLEAD